MTRRHDGYVISGPDWNTRGGPLRLEGEALIALINDDAEGDPMLTAAYGELANTTPPRTME